MEWFYARGEEQAGPVRASELLELRRSGSITDETLVWRDGMTDWIPFRDAAVSEEDDTGGSSSGTAAARGEEEEMAVCAFSGKRMPKARMVAYGDKFVAPEHKDAFVQRLREGAAMNDPAQLVPEDYAVDLGHSVRRAWQLLTADFWPVIGISFLVFIAYGAATNLPFVGALASMLLVWPIFAGLFYYYLRKMRGEPASLEHAFAGFTRNFGQLVLVNLVQSLIAFAAMIPGIILLVIGFVAQDQAGGGGEAMMGVFVAAGFVAILIPILYLYVAWMFAPFLIIDKMIPFWPAMQVSMKTVHKHLFAVLWFTFVIGLLSMAGVFALCFGFLVTWPLSMIALTYLYEDTFGHSPSNEPG